MPRETEFAHFTDLFRGELLMVVALDDARFQFCLGKIAGSF